MCLAAWWNAWMEFWGAVSDEFDPDVQRDRRAEERSWNLPMGVFVDGGNFEGAGTGGQD